MVKKLVVSLILCIFFNGNIFATHLVGGSMAYEFISVSGSGIHRYKVTLTLYRDCDRTNSVKFDETIDICVFENSGNRPLKTRKQFKLNTERDVDPIGRTDCPQTKDVCLKQGIYENFIDVEGSAFGYVLFWERCCRNILTNLPNDVSNEPYLGMSFQSIIPAASFRNSSPRFAGVPVPFICANDTTEIRSNAIDINGDNLEYRFVQPWSGGSTTDFAPICRQNYSGPANVIYNSGFSVSQPFGAGGIASINSTNGLITFLAPNAGVYAVAIEVIERRNGVILSIVRLELQILVLNCPINNTPVIAGGRDQQRSVEAGAKLCFNVSATDRDNHNISLKGYGDLLNGVNGFTGTRATFNNTVGRGSVTSEFCWQTDCNQANVKPYLFTAEAIDDGCPSKYTNVNVFITVRPFLSNIVITGPNSICGNSKNNVYTATGKTANSNLQWRVSSNASINGSSTSNSLSVNFSGTGLAKIYVRETSLNGCLGDEDSIQINLLPPPPAPVISGKVNVCENSLENYTLSGIIGSNTIAWFVEGGSIVNGQSTSSININWGVRGQARLKSIQFSQSNCPSDTAYYNVEIHRIDSPIIAGVQSICPYVQNVPYRIVGASSNFTYNWSVLPTGIIDQGQGTANVTIDWGNGVLTNIIRVTAFDNFGCPSDASIFPVNVGYFLAGEMPKGKTPVCENEIATYSVAFTPKSVYRWTVSGGTIIEGDTGNVIKIQWGMAGPAQIAVIENSFDTVNNLPCVSLPNIINTIIHPIPTANQMEGTFNICQRQGSRTNFTLNGLINSFYLWRVNGDSSNIIGQGTKTMQMPLNAEGVFNISVFEITAFGCTNFLVDSLLTIYPKPRTSQIRGDSIICFPLFSNKTYSVNGFSTSTFRWFVDGGVEVPNPSAINTTVIDWSGRQNVSVAVLETSDFGCIGDTQKTNVFADRPSIKFDLVTVNPPPGNDDKMLIFWTLNNGPRYNKSFEVQRRIAGTVDQFISVGTVGSGARNFTEFNINTDLNSFDYRVQGYDLCNQIIVSDTHTNVLLYGQKIGPYEVKMGFSAYQGWQEGVKEYQLYRYLPGKGLWAFESSFSSIQSSITLSNGLDNYSQCYRIKAIKDINGVVMESWSNEICFDFEPAVWIPSAFTINGDGRHESFKIVAGAFKTIEISVFNRWGEKVFRTNNINEGWNGDYKGNQCQQDVYMYIVRFTDFTDKPYIQSGTLHLLR